LVRNSGTTILPGEERSPSSVTVGLLKKQYHNKRENFKFSKQQSTVGLPVSQQIREKRITEILLLSS
jgi:hypothetical protein